MKYIFIVKGRPHVESVDKVIDDLNKTFSDLGGEGKLMYNAPLTTLDITVSRELTEDEIQKIKDHTKEVYSKEFSDVVVTLDHTENNT